MTSHHIAIDLGAESGRLMLGTLEDQRVSLEPIRRFPNDPRQTGDVLSWNVPTLWAEVRAGLRDVAARNLPIRSVSTDSWGVDYVLVDPAGRLIEPAYHYRDSRTSRGVAAVQARVSWPEIFAETGIQFMPLNTVYQLAAEPPARLASAGRMLMIADAFNHWLGGMPVIEESNASTTQLYDPRRRDWSARLIDALGFPSHLFPKVVPSGTVLGTLEESLRFETGLKEVEVIASCSHDTAAAVAAVPAEDEDWAYLSSGTWSLLGVERSSPLLTDACRDLNVTNEIGFGGSVRLLKNIVGLWIIQECRRAWAAGGQRWDYAQLTALAEAARPFVALINPADPRFLSPGGMPEKIQAFCRETDQPAPETPGAIVRCVLESMALLYHRTLRQIEQVTGRTIRRLHIVGGGSQNGLLNQFTADALEIPVVAGPVEATALGNILVQAIACRLIGGLDEARRLVRDSCEVAVLMPRAKERMSWARSVARFERLFSSTALGC